MFRFWIILFFFVSLGIDIKAQKQPFQVVPTKGGDRPGIKNILRKPRLHTGGLRMAPCRIFWRKTSQKLVEMWVVFAKGRKESGGDNVNGFSMVTQKLKTSIGIPGDYSLIWSKKEIVILLCGAGSNGFGVVSCFRKRKTEKKFRLEWAVKRENSDFLGIAYLKQEKKIVVLDGGGALLVARWDWSSGKGPEEFKLLVPPGKIGSVINFDISGAVLYAPIGNKARISVQHYDSRKSLYLIGADVLFEKDGSIKIEPDYGVLSLKVELADWPVLPGQKTILVEGTRGATIRVQRLDSWPRVIVGTGKISGGASITIQVQPLEFGVQYNLKVEENGFENCYFSPVHIVWHSRKGSVQKGEACSFSRLDLSLRENGFNVFVRAPFEREGNLCTGWAVLLLGVQCVPGTPPVFLYKGEKYLDPIGAAVVKDLGKSKKMYFEKVPVGYWGLQGFQIPRGSGLGRTVLWFQWVYKESGKDVSATNCYGFLVWPGFRARGNDPKKWIEPKIVPSFDPKRKVLVERWIKGTKVFDLVDGKDFVKRVVSRGL